MMSLLGGLIIGLAVSAMLFFNGRVTGISGIIGGLIKTGNGDRSWRLQFVLGLLTGGLLLRFFYPEALILERPLSYFDYAIGGFLVGFGTLLGNGCTSGHGVCGISRFSLRSIVATITFIIFGVIGLVIYKLFHGEL